MYSLTNLTHYVDQVSVGRVRKENIWEQTVMCLPITDVHFLRIFTDHTDQIKYTFTSLWRARDCEPQTPLSTWPAHELMPRLVMYRTEPSVPFCRISSPDQKSVSEMPPTIFEQLLNLKLAPKVKHNNMGCFVRP